MTPERWARVQESLEAFLELPRERRDAYLDEACKENPSLRDEVRSLAAQESTGSAVVGPGIEGERIGPYRIVREIGHGGMGVVYEAAQEKPVRRRVALKLIKLGMDTKQMIARCRGGRTSPWSTSPACRSSSTATSSGSASPSASSSWPRSVTGCSTRIRKGSSTATSSRGTFS